jgi:hypothetical protein
MAARRRGKVGGARPGAGRKPKPASEKQSEKFMATFTPSEAQALRRAAGTEPVGTFLRRLVVRHLRRVSRREAKE